MLVLSASVALSHALRLRVGDRWAIACTQAWQHNHAVFLGYWAECAGPGAASAEMANVNRR